LVAVRYDGDSVRLSFDAGGIGQTLVLKGGDGFELAGEDGIFKPAQVIQAGQDLLVSAHVVEIPRVVRYAWADNPEVSLYNTDGLPAAPFLCPIPERK
jgi:sialate O-acetylesterase